MGFASTIFYMNGVELSLVTEYVVEYLRPEGFFWLQSSITFLGVIFIHKYIIETMGLSDIEKKNIYIS